MRERAAKFYFFSFHRLDCGSVEPTYSYECLYVSGTMAYTTYGADYYLQLSKKISRFTVTSHEYIQ